jgi:putative zinc finger/helix-turn-helix YgiT family protein
MKQVIECAYCDGSAQLQKVSRDLDYRKDTFKVVEHFYRCEKCNEEFTTTETDTITMKQAHNQYRERYGIPFQEEIIAIREKYDIPASKMSEVLGLGINGYGNYEKGEVPSIAMGNLIGMIDDEIVFRDMLRKGEKHFSPNSYKSAMKRVNFLIDQKNNHKPFYSKLNQYYEARSLTGYRKPNKDRIASVLVTFLNQCDIEFNDMIKLNKLLFYTDFLNYKLFGQSITGLTYRAVKYGPVPTDYRNIYTYFSNEEIIESSWLKETNGSAKEVFRPLAECDAGLFNSHEKIVIEFVIQLFKNTSSWDLVDISHKEQAWIDLHAEKEVIDYQHYAFSLRGANGIEIAVPVVKL